jgi:hypothetical protein
MAKYETSSDQTASTPKVSLVHLNKREIFTLYAMQALLTRTDVTLTALPAKAQQIAEEVLQRLNETSTSDIPKSY